jgi:Pyruvate decarboxylase and related thiamine pyrophosphate-requiring enzymes
MTIRATTVFDYIVQRLVDEGITQCFGVPADYAFPVCDADVKGIGCSNDSHLAVMQTRAEDWYQSGPAKAVGDH